jgi:hypothetical protein
LLEGEKRCWAIMEELLSEVLYFNQFFVTFIMTGSKRCRREDAG